VFANFHLVIARGGHDNSFRKLSGNHCRRIFTV
jgi:hypothetical protein